MRMPPIALLAAAALCGALPAQDSFFDSWLARSDHAKADQLSQATLGPMHQPRRDGFSGKVIHRETL